MPKKVFKEKKSRPLYEAVINPDDDTTGVKLISLVDDPAIEVKGIYLGKKRNWANWSGIITPPCHYDSNDIPNCQCTIAYNPISGADEWLLGDTPCNFCIQQKERWEDLNTRLSSQKFTANKEQKIIAGPVLIPNKNIYRKDPDTGDEYDIVFSPEVITQIVQKFNKGNNNKSINLQHTNTMSPAYIQENWLIADPVYDKSKVYGYNLPVNTWFAVVKVEDDAFWENEVKNLGMYSFSIEGIIAQKLVHLSINKAKKDIELMDFLTDLELIQLADEILKITKA